MDETFCEIPISDHTKQKSYNFPLFTFVFQMKPEMYLGNEIVIRFDFHSMGQE